MFEGGYKNREEITVSNRNRGVVIMPEPIYQYPEGHPCHGCIFTLWTSGPSCLTGDYPDTGNCINTFYGNIQARWRTGREDQPAQAESKE
jgi:hypothetical protein